MTENTNYASHGNEGVNRTFRRCKELEREIERLQLALNQSETACGHLSADLGEAREEIERLQARLQAANAEVIAASEQAARDAEAANDMMQQRDKCRRLLREIVAGNWSVTEVQEVLGDIQKAAWDWQGPAHAGGEHE